MRAIEAGKAGHVGAGCQAPTAAPAPPAAAAAAPAPLHPQDGVTTSSCHRWKIKQQPGAEAPCGALGTVRQERCGGRGAAPDNTDGHHIPAPAATSHLITPGNTVSGTTLPTQTPEGNISNRHTFGTTATLPADHNTRERR